MKRTFFFAYIALLYSVFLSSPAFSQPPPPAPELGQWEENMRFYGRAHCEFLKQPKTLDELLSQTYYDAQRVFYQIADYTGDKYWDECARVAAAIYRDKYVIPNRGRVPGYWNFSEGLARDYRRRRVSRSLRALSLLVQNAAFASSSSNLALTVHPELARETAYAILSYIDLERLGGRRSSNLKLLVRNALRHNLQWFKTRRVKYVRPFMVAINHEALIAWYDLTHDRQVLRMVKLADDWMWKHLWRADAGSFVYTDRFLGDPEDRLPAPDLNLLIAPSYAWLYHMTGEIQYREQADKIFAGGVRNAWLGSGKQFNQNYRWSFKYLEWRQTVVSGAR